MATVSVRRESKTPSGIFFVLISIVLVLMLVAFQNGSWDDISGMLNPEYAANQKIIKGLKEAAYAELDRFLDGENEAFERLQILLDNMKDQVDEWEDENYPGDVKKLQGVVDAIEDILEANGQDSQTNH